MQTAGKSTLINAIVGQKLSIVTPKAQTTRHRVMGIASESHYQMILFDTPGIIEQKVGPNSCSVFAGTQSMPWERTGPVHLRAGWAHMCAVGLYVP